MFVDPFPTFHFLERLKSESEVGRDWEGLHQGPGAIQVGAGQVEVEVPVWA